MGQSRSEIIAAVAQSLRQESATNIQSVVDRTHIAEQVVVSEFGSMDGLILALVSQLIDALSLPLQDPPQGREEFWRRLLQFCESLAEAYSCSHLRGLYRIAITESIRNSGIGKKFYEVGPKCLTQRLASFLEGGRHIDAIGPVDSHLAAEYLVSLMRASLDLVDNSPDGSPAEGVHAHIAAVQAIDLFRDGILGRKEQR